MRKRIDALASLVPPNLIVADIGTDHAYLIVSLARTNKLKYAYAIDNKDGPINNAKDTIDKNKLDDYCEVIKADGLSFTANKKIEVLVFAGLGGLNAISIIDKDKDKLNDVKYIITDVHRDEIKLINYLKNLGFVIEKDIALIDKNKKYHLIRFNRV